MELSEATCLSKPQGVASAFPPLSLLHNHVYPPLPDVYHQPPTFTTLSLTIAMVYSPTKRRITKPHPLSDPRPPALYPRWLFHA